MFVFQFIHNARKNGLKAILSMRILYFVCFCCQYCLKMPDLKYENRLSDLLICFSLVKMVYAFAAQSKQKPSQRQLIAAIRRNFGGLDTVDPVKSFRRLLPSSLCDKKVRTSG